MGVAMTQMNTRIDAELKRSGDAVLRGLGLTPSAAVRGLWAYLVREQDDPAALRRVIDPDASGEDSSCGPSRALSSLRRRYAETAAVLVLDPSAPVDAPSWDELRDAWYEERLGDEG